MNLLSRILPTAFVVGATLLAASASAERVYYLVGVRHVYRIGPDKYFQSSERQKIEGDYADEVSADNAHYQYQISNGGNITTESASLQSALGDLAVERDTRLAALYPETDDVRKDHSAFNIQVDGPYQVIGVDYHYEGNVDVWDNYTPYAPWPGYTTVGTNPYGWSYGTLYTPDLFVGAYRGWYGGWIGYGCPAFVGLYGIGGPLIVAGLSVNVGLGFGIGFGFGGFYSNSGLGGYYHRGPGYFGHDPFRGGYISNNRDPRAGFAGRAGYAAGASAVRSARSAGYANGIRAGARSSFAGNGSRNGSPGTLRSSSSRTGFGNTGNGYAHSAMGTRSQVGGPRSGFGNTGTGYAHSSMGTRSQSGAFAGQRNNGVRTRSSSGMNMGRQNTNVRTSNTNRSSGFQSNQVRSSAPTQRSAPQRSNNGGGNRGGGGHMSSGGGSRGGGGGRHHG